MQTIREFENVKMYGEIEKLDHDILSKKLAEPDVSHIEVFEATEEEIDRRQKLVGKKFTVKKRYQKTGSNKKRK